jgi:hypothetical protein
MSNSNLVTLTQDEIDRFGIKGKQVGDAITAEEYSKYQKEYLAGQDKSRPRSEADTSAEDKKPAKK